MLSRTRVLRELENSQNARYREMLNHALADLDQQLSALMAAASAVKAATAS